MDLRRTGDVIVQYARLRPFLTLFFGYSVGLWLGDLVIPGNRAFATAIILMIAGAFLWFAWSQRQAILQICFVLLVFGFAYQTLSLAFNERKQQKFLDMANSQPGDGEHKVWQIYFEGKTNRALRTRGVFVKGEVLGFTEKGVEASLAKQPVWVHFPMCSSKAGYVAVPTSEMECVRSGQREFVRLPLLVYLVGRVTRMPSQLVAFEEWADQRDAPSLLITAEQWITSKRLQETERRDLRRRQVEDFLTLSGCFEAIREKPYCQMFAVFLGHNFIQLSPGISAKFRRTGMIHLIVPSGAQVTFAILIFLYIAQKVRRLRLLMVLVCVAMVGWSVGFFGGIPMWRAAGISLVALAGFLFYVEGDYLNQTAAVGLALLLLQPNWLFDPSFQMSMLASSGMVLGSQMVRGRGLGYAILRALAGTFGAQLLLFPALAGISGTLTPWTAIANLTMAPIVSAALGLGYFAFALSVLGWRSLAAVLVFPLNGILWIGLKILVLFSELPVILRENTTITPAYLFFFGILVFAASEAFYFRSPWRWPMASLVVSALIFAIVPVGVPSAYVYSTGAGTVLHFPQEGLWIGNPYWEEWWRISRRMGIARTRTAFILFYPATPHELDLSRVAIALSQRYEWLRILPEECRNQADRHLGVEYCCYGRQLNCMGQQPTTIESSRDALVAKVANGLHFLIHWASNRLEVVTDQGLYCISLHAVLDCKGTAIGLADGVVVEGKQPYTIRGLWGIRPGKPPREMPDWWFRGIE